MGKEDDIVVIESANSTTTVVVSQGEQGPPGAGSETSGTPSPDMFAFAAAYG